MKMSDLLYASPNNKWARSDYRKNQVDRNYEKEFPSHHHPNYQTSPSDKLRIINILTHESLHGFNNSSETPVQLGFQGIHPDDEFLLKHSRRVSEICVMLGKELGLTNGDLRDLKIAGMLHDVGKVYIPHEIMNQPGKLSKESWDRIKTHTVLGYELLKEVKEFSSVAKFVRSHHERIDGSGYPDGLIGKDIPLGSRIIGVVDAYEAMTNARHYRQAISKEKAIEELKRNSGTQFDKVIVDVFINKVVKNLS
jgi:putative nucleotidyltransferase with HDIG domain